jgi:DNA-binding response OmpR family regulator
MKRKKALVAEDNDEHFKMFKSYLEEMSLDVEREAFGDDALKKLLNSDYDVAVIDVELPKLNGREIVTAVRRAKPFLPIIVVSAFAGVHGEAECINLGADDFIEKRFNKDTFQARVKRAMWHGSVANAKKTAAWRGISVNISEHSVHYRKTPMQFSDK